MGDSVRRDSGEERLSQLKKKFLAHISFLSKRSFSAFAMLFLGTGVFPALPPIDTKNFIASQGEEEMVVTPVLSHEELCHWQKDFAFFSRLTEGKRGVSESGKEKSCNVKETESIEATQQKAVSDDDLSRTIRELTIGYPLEIMAPAISAYDRSVAALIVGIAKKESNWGKRVPRSPDGADCFNYWGFKGAGSRGIAMGHGCFGSPEEAVQAVGNRIAELVALRETSEPKNMIIWKCGSSCATHSPESVRKWIADVDLYYRQIVKN